MTLRNVIVTMLVLWLGMVGIVCGFLCLACLILVLFWQGVGPSTVILALTSLSCLGLAFIFAGRVVTARPTLPHRRRRSVVRRLWRLVRHNNQPRSGTALDEGEWERQTADYESWLKHTHEETLGTK
jgi:hypothetical protein